MCCKRVIWESYFVLLPPRSTNDFDQLQLLLAGHQQLPPAIAATLSRFPHPLLVIWEVCNVVVVVSVAVVVVVALVTAVVSFAVASLPYTRLCCCCFISPPCQLSFFRFCFMCKNWFLCTFSTHTKTHTRAYELLFIKYILWKQRLTANYKVLSATGMGT